MDRNSKKIVKKDIEFLKEMLFNLTTSNYDLSSFDQLKTMMSDWKSELEELLKN